MDNNPVKESCYKCGLLKGTTSGINISVARLNTVVHPEYGKIRVCTTCFPKMKKHVLELKRALKKRKFSLNLRSSKKNDFKRDSHVETVITGGRFYSGADQLHYKYGGKVESALLSGPVKQIKTDTTSMYASSPHFRAVKQLKQLVKLNHNAHTARKMLLSLKYRNKFTEKQYSFITAMHSRLMDLFDSPKTRKKK